MYTHKKHVCAQSYINIVYVQLYAYMYRTRTFGKPARTKSPNTDDRSMSCGLKLRYSFRATVIADFQGKALVRMRRHSADAAAPAKLDLGVCA